MAAISATPVALRRAISELAPVFPAPSAERAAGSDGLEGVPKPAMTSFIAIPPRLFGGWW